MTFSRDSHSFSLRNVALHSPLFDHLITSSGLSDRVVAVAVSDPSSDVISKAHATTKAVCHF